MKSKNSSENKQLKDQFSGKPKENKEIDLILSGPGWLKTADQEGVVQFFFCSEHRGPPRIGDIYCDQAVLESAWTAGHAVLSAFGTKVRVEVAGVNMQNGALTVRAAPVFRALAKQMKNAA